MFSGKKLILCRYWPWKWFLSNIYGEYEGKLADYQTLGVLYYAIYNPLSGRRGRFKNRERLAVYKLIAGKYELLEPENNRVWLPEIGLALGYEQGEHIAWVREWLYWYDRSGNRYLTAEERARAAAAMAEQASLIAQQERLAKQEAEQKAQRLAERLRALGINPDEV